MTGRVALFTVCLWLTVVGSACVGQATPISERAMPKNFAECLAAGGKILKSFPAQCITDAGDRFVEDRELSAEKRGCVNVCGDGKCQEMVCMMKGCPCAESHRTCPSDCRASQ